MTRLMTPKHTRRAMALCGTLLAACALTGCNSGSGASMDKSEEANFKGGPMPPEAAAAMKKAQEASRTGAGPKTTP